MDSEARLREQVRKGANKTLFNAQNVRLECGGVRLGIAPVIRACPICLNVFRFITMVEKTTNTCCYAHCAKGHCFCFVCLGSGSCGPKDGTTIPHCANHTPNMCPHPPAARQVIRL